MKKRMKRFLVLLMTAALMVSMLSVGALAEGEAEETSEEAVSEEETGGETVSEEDAEADTDAEEAETVSEEEDSEETASGETEAVSEDVVEEAAAAEEAAVSDEAAAEDTSDDTSTSDTVVYVKNSDNLVTDSDGKKVLVITSGVSDTTYYVEDGVALTIRGSGNTSGSSTSSEDPIVFENCTFILSGYTQQINKSGVSGVGDNGESLARLGVAGNVTFKNCEILFYIDDEHSGGKTTSAGYDCAVYLYTGNITFEDSSITGTDWTGQGIGLFGYAAAVFKNCNVSTTGNYGAWSYACYKYSTWKMYNSTLSATGMSGTSTNNTNCFYTGDESVRYDGVWFDNTKVYFEDNKGGGFAPNYVNIYVNNSEIYVNNNAGNASNAGYWYVSDSIIQMNGNKGGHALSCETLTLKNSTLEILHNGYAGLYIRGDSSMENSTVDIRCNGEKLLSYTAGDTWIGRYSSSSGTYARYTLTVTNCTSNALEGSAWLGAVGRMGYIITSGCSVVAFDLNELADDNVKSSTEDILTGSSSSASVALSDTNNVLASVTTGSLTNGTDYNALLGDDEHILLLNPWMTSDYARGNGENTSSDNDADLFDDDNNKSGSYDSNYIIAQSTAKIGTLTTAQLSHHIYDFDTIVKTVAATATTYGYASYACVDVCAEYTNNTEEHTWSYDCDGTYVYAPLVGLHFEANAYDDDGNDVSDTVEGMPDDQTTITFSGTAETVSDPTREGYVFAGWYLDEDCTEEFDFSTNLNACWTVVYAKWVKATTVTVTKTWDDADDADGIRPESVTVELCADDEATGKILTLSEDNDWTASFTGIAAYSDDEETITISYTVVEETVDGYTAVYSDLSGNAADGYEVSITNVHEPADEEIDDDTDDTDDTGDTDDTEDTDDAEDVEDVEASDTGDPGVMLWIALLGAAAVCILICKKRIAR